MAAISSNFSTQSHSNVSICLNRQLSGAIELRRQVRNAHWNTGTHTSAPAARLFGDMIREIDQYAALLATRIAGLGDVLNQRALVDCGEEFLYPLGIRDEYHHVVAMSLEFANFGEAARNCHILLADSTDTESSALFCTLARMVDQQLWRAAPVARQLKPSRSMAATIAGERKKTHRRFSKMPQLRVGDARSGGG